uniref:Uncharacterized protein n=1 Tax=Acrobeloides nanus TaxID=290746 RepID=A0A914E4D8_9BILA
MDYSDSSEDEFSDIGSGSDIESEEEVESEVKVSSAFFTQQREVLATKNDAAFAIEMQIEKLAPFAVCVKLQFARNTLT